MQIEIVRGLLNDLSAREQHVPISERHARLRENGVSRLASFDVASPRECRRPHPGGAEQPVVHDRRRGAVDVNAAAAVLLRLLEMSRRRLQSPAAVSEETSRALSKNRAPRGRGRASRHRALDR